MLKVKRFCDVAREDAEIIEKIKKAGSGLVKDYTVVVVYDNNGDANDFLCHGDIQIYPMDKVAVSRNKDWVSPVVNKDFQAWAEHNGTVITPAKVRSPR